MSWVIGKGRASHDGVQDGCGWVWTACGMFAPRAEDNHEKAVAGRAYHTGEHPTCRTCQNLRSRTEG